MSAKKNREPTALLKNKISAQKQQQQQQAKIHAGLTVPLSKANLALQRGEWPVPEERYFTGEAVLEDATGDAANTTNTSYIAKALDFDIPKLTKFLLLSAYIVSKNDESVDNRLFATEGAVGNHRKRGRLAHDRNVDRAPGRSLEDTNASNWNASSPSSNTSSADRTRKVVPISRIWKKSSYPRTSSRKYPARPR